LTSLGSSSPFLFGFIIFGLNVNSDSSSFYFFANSSFFNFLEVDISSNLWNIGFALLLGRFVNSGF
jgi:hypothetical protein